MEEIDNWGKLKSRIQEIKEVKVIKVLENKVEKEISGNKVGLNIQDAGTDRKYLKVIDRNMEQRCINEGIERGGQKLNIQEGKVGKTGKLLGDIADKYGI